MNLFSDLKLCFRVFMFSQTSLLFGLVTDPKSRYNVSLFIKTNITVLNSKQVSFPIYRNRKNMTFSYLISLI